jgi:hypothetical protein
MKRSYGIIALGSGICQNPRNEKPILPRWQLVSFIAKPSYA